MSIVIKEIIVKTIIEKKNGGIVSDELIQNIKNSILKELKQEKISYKTNKKDR